MLTQKGFSMTSHQRGVGLIEVLVAMLILTVGILGLVGLQTRALQFSQETLLSSQALMIAYEMTDRIRANKNNADEYEVLFGESVSAGTDCTAASCTPDQIALYELSEWKSNVAMNLPMGDAQIVRDVSGVRPFYTITVRFQDAKLDKALSGGTGAAATREVSVRTEI